MKNNRQSFLENAIKSIAYFVVLLALIFAQGYLYNNVADTVWYAVLYIIIVLLMVIIMVLMIAAWDDINNNEGRPYG